MQTFPRNMKTNPLAYAIALETTYQLLRLRPGYTITREWVDGSVAASMLIITAMNARTA